VCGKTPAANFRVTILTPAIYPDIQNALLGAGILTPAQRKAVLNHRRHQKRQGIARIEVQVGKDDAALVRTVARALRDPERAAQTRALLRDRFGEAKAKGLKALLASAPLEGVDLDRAHDFGRDVDL
jgi:hypothetical protein